MRLLLSVLLALMVLIPATSCEGLPDRTIPESGPQSGGPETSSPPETAVPPEPSMPEEEPEPVLERLTIVVAGDLMAHSDQLIDAYNEEYGSYDFNHCFEPVKDDLTEGYAIGNLETVFGGPEIGYSDYPQFSTPDAYGEALKNNGFDFVSTCNNHSLDKYEAGVLRTLQVLDELGLAHTGTYASFEEQDEITVVEAEGFRIAILAFTFSTNGIPMPQGKEYLVNMMTEEKVIGDLEKARALKPDLIVCLPHNGNEYEEEARDVFVYWLDLMLYHGADLVFASHPHVLQQMMVRELTDIEGREKTGFIMCSMGNFISSQRYEPREASVILKVDLSRYGDEKPVIDAVRFVPTYVQFKDAMGKYLIRVLPIGDAVESLPNGENPFSLSAGAIERLYRASGEITARYLGAPVPREEIRREYVFYRRD